MSLVCREYPVSSRVQCPRCKSNYPSDYHRSTMPKVQTCSTRERWRLKTTTLQLLPQPHLQALRPMFPKRPPMAKCHMTTHLTTKMSIALFGSSYTRYPSSPCLTRTQAVRFMSRSSPRQLHIPTRGLQSLPMIEPEPALQSTVEDEDLEALAASHGLSSSLRPLWGK